MEGLHEVAESVPATTRTMAGYKTVIPTPFSVSGTESPKKQITHLWLQMGRVLE
jgi:hypothetical protein